MELLNVCIRNGKTAEAPGILMIRIGEELAAVCAGYYQHAELPTESVLNQYENMRPDDAQLRRAMDRLLAVPSAIGPGAYSSRLRSKSGFGEKNSTIKEKR